MNEPNYSKRELDSLIKDIHASLTRIETQTTKTNGAVANLKLWRAYHTGAVAVLTGLVLPIVLIVISKQI